TRTAIVPTKIVSRIDLAISRLTSFFATDLRGERQIFDELFDFIRRCGRKTFQRNLAHLTGIYLRENVPDTWNHRGNHTQVDSSKSDQQHSVSRRGRHLTAHNHGNSRLFRRFHGALDPVE